MPMPAPPAVAEALEWSAATWQEAYAELAEAPLDAATLDQWLRQWSQLGELVWECFARLSLASTQDTSDAAADSAYQRFLREIYPPTLAADQRLKQRLLSSGLTPEGMAVPLRAIRSDAELFRAESLPLLAEERRLAIEYNRIIGAQSISWQGAERPLPQLAPLYQEPDRALREQVWRLASARQLADRPALNALWGQLYALRGQIAANAGLASYRDYAWRQRQRFDYTPEDGARFQESIAQVAVPAAQRVLARRAARLGLDRLRPWDAEARPAGQAPLLPFADEAGLVVGAERVLGHVGADFGSQIATMRDLGQLDLANRAGKAPGGYCTSFPVSRQPFIFMNAVGLASDVRTILHEAGHAFHSVATSALPYIQQRSVPMEFNEVASMAMELLAAPYLRARDGGYYADDEYARARVEHLEGILLFWPYMAVVDAFQHWAYTSPDGGDPAACDQAWGQLWDRFMLGTDWSGLDDERVTGWHRKQHIYRAPFYYVEYGLAQLGAVQVWRGSLADPAGALAAYRRALSLGGTATLPELYAAAGARLAFDAETLGAAVDLIEQTIAELDEEPERPRRPRA